MTAAAFPAGPGASGFVDDMGRWATAGLIVAVVHVLIAYAVLTQRPPPEPPGEQPAAIMIDLEALGAERGDAEPACACPAAGLVGGGGRAGSRADRGGDRNRGACSGRADGDGGSGRCSRGTGGGAARAGRGGHGRSGSPPRDRASRHGGTGADGKRRAEASDAQPTVAAPVPVTEDAPPVPSEPLRPAPAQIEPSPSAEAEPPVQPVETVTAATADLPPPQLESVDPSELTPATEELAEAPPLEAAPSAPAEPDPTAVAPVEPAETQVAAVEPEPLRPAETTAEPIMAEEVEQLTEEVVVAARLPRPRPEVVPEPRRTEAPARPTRQRKPAPEKPPTRTAAAPPAAPSAPVAAPRQAVAHRAPSAGATAARSSVSPDRWKSAVVRHLGAAQALSGRSGARARHRHGARPLHHRCQRQHPAAPDHRKLRPRRARPGGGGHDPPLQPGAGPAAGRVPAGLEPGSADPIYGTLGDALKPPPGARAEGLASWSTARAIRGTIEGASSSEFSKSQFTA